MSASAHISPSARTWRDIPQSIAPRAMSSTGRKRMIFASVKSVAALVFVCACLWAGYEVYRTWQENPAKLKAPVKSAVVKSISLRGQNLTLDQPWVSRTLALPKTADLMELDLFALRDRLLASGQVRAAELSRKFPDTLVVSIEERSPVARINARVSDDGAETFLVARDGVVFRGECFKDEVVQSLPFLGGIALKRSAGKFLPIPGMEVVADLLSTARVNAPNLYRSWSVISLAKLASDGQIIVQSPDVGEAIFGTRDDFYKQIARLDYIITESRSRPVTTALKSVNLAVGGEQVPVSFEPPPAAEPEHAPGHTARPANSVSPAPSHLAATPATHPTALRVAPTRPLQANTAYSHRSSRRDL